MQFVWPLVLVGLYALTVVKIGRHIARNSWYTWHNRERNTLRAKLLFPFYTLVQCTGEDYFGWSHPFVPIVHYHGLFSGNGFGVLEADPSAKNKYLVFASTFWLPKVAVCISMVLFVGAFRTLIWLMEKSIIVFNDLTNSSSQRLFPTE